MGGPEVLGWFVYVKGKAQESREVCSGRSLAAEKGGGESSATAKERKSNGKNYASKSQLSWLSLLVLAKT